MRKIIIHYHIFKNAGSSLDLLFKRHFGQAFVEEEFNQHNAIVGNVPLLEKWIESNPSTQVLSSHTAHMPPPAMEGVQVFPVVMLRHPLLRFKSAYEFERKQPNVTTWGTKFAKSYDFKGYIEAYLALPGNINCRNYQACRLAPRSAWHADDLEQKAIAAFNALPFVGVVEEFESSVLVLEDLLAPHFPGFKTTLVWENAGDRRTLSDTERLVEIERELGTSLYAKVLALNSIDLKLREKAFARLDALRPDQRSDKSP